jgi:L-fucose mutarotase/ribose pyranase (RbsD/FucU family)
MQNYPAHARRVSILRAEQDELMQMIEAVLELLIAQQHPESEPETVLRYTG